MDFNLFKDFLFELINESDVLDVADVVADNKNDLLLVTMKDNSKFRLHMEEV